MTSEAKIGLLLGLVFIFIIAFIINGLPSFWNKTDGNELTVAMENAQDDSMGLGVNERKAGEAIERIELVTAANTNPSVQVQAESDVRFATDLPEYAPNTSGNMELQPVTVAQALPPQSAEQAAETIIAPKVEQKTYTVCAGDSLYVIAKRFYGVAQANKKSTLDMIFRANRNILKSPDELKIGQKLVIPALSSGKLTNKSPAENVTTVTEQAPQTSGTAQQFAADNNTTVQTRDYVVQDGDSLWKIAAKQLGNGSKYEEIMALNGDVLKNSDDLAVGMHLKLPVR